MDKKMENDMETLGPFKGVYGYVTPTMENQTLELPSEGFWDVLRRMKNQMDQGM